jgi:peptide/nickel transport system ATP-binding protein
VSEGIVLELAGLRVETPGGDAIVEDVGLDLRRGEILGLVGESGCGKTTTALSLFGYAQGGARIHAGDFTLDGERLATWDALRGARGRLISYLPQSSGTALNPSLRVRAAIGDMLAEHGGDVERGARERVLEKVGLPSDAEFQRRFPHQLSGGQQQRVCTAIAIVGGPPMVVLDEPTTGLDVVTQARVLEELLRLRDEEGVAMLYVTHDLAVVAQIADRIAVMYAGRIVEQGPAHTVLTEPRHPYTRGLLASIPDHASPRRLEPMSGVVAGVGERPPGCAFAPRCPLHRPHCDEAMPPLFPVGPNHQARCYEWERTPELRLQRANLEARAGDPAAPTVLEVRGLRAEHAARRGGAVVAAEDVWFTVARGECVALVGESGSGKTTIARTIVGLHPVAGGELRLFGETLPAMARRRSIEQRRRVQIVFQNPGEALNPRHTVRAAIARPLRVLRGMSRAAAEAEVSQLLDQVRLPQRVADRYPLELSGGERQRVGIARALAPQPELIVCDEITSALDVSVQAAVLQLLGELRDELGLSMLFITHDLGVVATIADRVLVLEQGRVCEEGSVAAVLTAPEHPYTRRLLASAPSLAGILPA